MIEHPVTLQKNHISAWYIDTPLWDEILLECEKKKILFEREPTGWRGYSNLYLDVLSNKCHNEYQTIMDKCLEEYKEHYPFLKTTLPIKYQSRKEDKPATFKIQKYKPGKFYSQLHCENDGTYPYRVLGFMTYLTNIDGGGTAFPNQKFETKSEKGLTLIWPASFTHIHAGIPAEKDTKIIITGWFEWQVN